MQVCRAHAKSRKVYSVVVNSGNANAFTGKHGREAVQLSAKSVAEALGCGPEEVLLASTGVIGASVTLLGVMALPAMMAQNYSKAIATGTIADAQTATQFPAPSVASCGYRSLPATQDPVGSSQS